MFSIGGQGRMIAPSKHQDWKRSVDCSPELSLKTARLSLAYDYFFSSALSVEA
jgi:hypothetical protein